MQNGNLQKKDRIVKQILAIRDEGKTNMLDKGTVQRLAFEHEFYELVCLIEDDPKAYAHFIFTGELNVEP